MIASEGNGGFKTENGVSMYSGGAAVAVQTCSLSIFQIKATAAIRHQSESGEGKLELAFTLICLKENVE